jgi:predicted oxidoreductase
MIYWKRKEKLERKDDSVMKFPISGRIPGASRLILGCMGFGGGWNTDPVTAEHVKQGHEALEAALEAGINFLDHADIYTMGKAETVFGQVLKERPGLRDKLVIQSKCGIRLEGGPGNPARYDFSKEHILASVRGSLDRLGIEQLDVLLLHRPDPLMEPDEVAEALDILKASGQVRFFGVSNMSAAQIGLLQASCKDPFIVNQLELSLSRLDWLTAGVTLNRKEGAGLAFPEGTLEYCRLNGIQLQSWGPLSKGLFSSPESDDQPEHVRETGRYVARLAREKETTAEAVVLAWVMRHPAGIQPVIGTTRPERIRACGGAGQVELTREEWYSLFALARGQRIP